MKKKLLSIALVVASLGVLSSCGAKEEPTTETPATETTETAPAETTEAPEEVVVPNPGAPIVVGTMNDTEGDVLGNMICLALENAGYEVTNNSFKYAGIVNGRNALLSDEIDIFVDYTSNGLSIIENVDPSLYREDELAWEAVNAAETDVRWLRYAPFNNTDALAVTREFAEANNVFTMEDLARFSNEGGDVVMMTHSYYSTSPTGLPLIQSEYGFTVPADKLTVQDVSLAQILAEGTDGVNVAHIYATSGMIPALDLVVLEDTKGVNPVYCPAPIVRNEVLEAYPEIEPILNEVFESISTDEMVLMNSKVVVDGVPGSDVAREYLVTKNLIAE